MGKQSDANVLQTIANIADIALNDMCNYAKSIGVEVGVASIVVVDNKYPGCNMMFSLTNNSAVRMGVVGKNNVNFAGVAAAKIAQMMRTAKPSGQDDGVIGEVPYKGGVCGEGVEYSAFVAYSGGTQEEDVQISEVGMDFMSTLLRG